MVQRIPLASMAISVVGRCPLACKHCYELSSPKTPGEFSFEQLVHYINVGVQFGIRHVFLAGGEPLLHHRIADVVERAVQAGVHPNISTNGHLITDEILNKLHAGGMTHDLSVSLDGPNPLINDSVRGRGAFVRTLQGMYTLNRFQKILWGVNCVSCGPTIGYALETALLAKRMGASYFNLIRVTPFGRTLRFKETLLISDEQYAAEVASVAQHFRPFGSFFEDIHLFDLAGDLGGRASAYFDHSDFEGLPCGISINHKGEVGLSPPLIDLGNCLTSDLADLISSLESPLVQELYQKWLRNEHVGIHQPPGFPRNL